MLTLRSVLWLAGVLSGLPLSAQPAFAQETASAVSGNPSLSRTDYQTDPAVLKALDEVAAAHQALTSFSATVQFASVEGEKKQTVTTRLAYCLPNKVQATTTLSDTTTVRVISDGANELFVLNSRTPRTYRAQPCSPNRSNIALGLVEGKTTGLLPMLATNKKASASILGPQTTFAEFAPDETIDGTECRVIHATMKDKAMVAEVTIAYSKADMLLRRTVARITTPQGSTVLTEHITDIQVNPNLSTDTFVFTPPPNAKPEEELLPSKPVPYDPHLTVGANPLPFSGKDMMGKPITLATYRGKVVLIDFWATWCGPCVAELPNVVKVYNKFHPKGFEVIGVSLDEKGDQNKLVRFAAEHQMPWVQIYDGDGWQSALAKRYGVQSIPFTVLIGRDGKIAAVGARGDKLDSAVAEALAKR